MKKYFKKIYNFLRKTSLRQGGYTLVELSISTSIIAILAVGGLAILQKKNSSDSIRGTSDKLKEIQKSIKSFARSNGYIPCAAPPGLPESDSLFGKSVVYNSVSGVCDNDAANDGVGDSDINGDSSLTAADILENGVGAVPVRTLNLLDDVSYDGWDRKFAYRTSSFSGDANNFENVAFLGDVAIVNRQGTHKTNIHRLPPNNDGAAYVIISHGSNGHNVAWRKNNTTAPAQATGIENVNTDHEQSIYMQDKKSEGFDDIVVFASKNEIVVPKNISSPVQVTSQVCENAKEIIENGQTHADLTNFRADASVSNALADLVYKNSELLELMCDSNPIDLVSPANLTGLVLWLDSSDTGSLFTDTSCTAGNQPTNLQTVACWLDKSGNNNNGISSISGQRPVYEESKANNKATLYFNGVNDHFSLPDNIISGTSARTFFVVARADTDATGEIPLLSLTTSSTSGARYDVNGEVSVKISGGNKMAEDSVSIRNANDYSIVSVVNEESSDIEDSLLAVNGALQTYALSTPTAINTGTGGVTRIGITNIGGFRLKGSIAEIIAYDRVLNEADRTKIEAYLAKKWGVSLDSADSNYCPDGLAWRKTSDSPEGGCVCPEGTVLASKLENNNACALESSTSFSLCVDENQEVSYQNEPVTTGQVLWLDANDCTTVTLEDDSNKVTSWADKGINGYVITQSNSDRRPLYINNSVNGNSVIKFDGIDDYLLNTSFFNFDDITVIAVGTYDVGDNSQCMLNISQNASGNGALMQYRTDSTIFSSYDGTTDESSFEETLPTMRIFTGVSDGESDYYYVNGNMHDKTDSANITSTTNRLYLGSNAALSGYFLKGNIAEIIVYDRVLSNSERESVEGYLAEKYGIIREPSDIANLALWLDASDLDTVYDSTDCTTTPVAYEGEVGCWRDKSGNNYHVTSMSAARKPAYKLYAKNSLPTIEFDGSNDMLNRSSFNIANIADLDETTLFTVYKYNSPTHRVSPVSWHTNGNANSRFTIYAPSEGSEVGFHFKNNANSGYVGYTPTFMSDIEDKFNILTMNRCPTQSQCASNNQNIWVNGDFKVGGNKTPVFTSSEQGTLSIGAWYNSSSGDPSVYMNGEIGEVIIYNKAITDEERILVEEYLSAKWDIDLD